MNTMSIYCIRPSFQLNLVSKTDGLDRFSLIRLSSLTHTFISAYREKTQVTFETYLPVEFPCVALPECSFSKPSLSLIIKTIRSFRIATWRHRQQWHNPRMASWDEKSFSYTLCWCANNIPVKVIANKIALNYAKLLCFLISNQQHLAPI